MTLYVLTALLMVAVLVGIPLMNDAKADQFGVLLFWITLLYLVVRCLYVIWTTLVNPHAFYKGIKKVAIDEDGICFIHEPGRFHKVGWKGVVCIRYWNDIALIDFTALPTFIVKNNEEFRDMISQIEKYRKLPN